MSLDERDLARLRDAADAVVETHRALSAFLRVGMKLDEIDNFVRLTLGRLNCKSCFYRYKVPGSPPFPSYACLSVNECVVHGTAGYYREPLRSGDVLKVDIGTKKAGWIGDAAWTYVFGKPSDETHRLCECGKESLRLGVQQLRPGNTLMEWARVVQRHAEEVCGFKMIRGLGGHGYGRALHAPPFISNVIPNHPSEWTDGTKRLVPGMALAVEPMIAVGSSTTVTHPSKWPLMTSDGSQSVHYEHDVVIGTDGPIVLTAGLQEIEDIIDR